MFAAIGRFTYRRRRAVLAAWALAFAAGLAATVASVEPVVDRAQLAFDDARLAGLFGDLAEGGLSRGLAGLDAALGEPPHAAADGVDQADFEAVVHAHDHSPRGCRFSYPGHAVGLPVDR